MTSPRSCHAPVVALDFDGVICDSMNECMLVAYAAYTGTQAIPVAFVRYFRKYRHFVRPAQEYWLIVEAYQRGMEPVTEYEFNALAQECKEQVAQFESVYFQTRERLRSSDFKAWLKLHTMYPEFSEGWPLVERFAIPYIVTTRDRGSLKYLLESFGINIPAENWWTKERTRSKPEAILAIARERNIRPAEILFVDDHPEHLHDVAQTGASVFWAAWGFWSSQNGFQEIGTIKELMQRLEIDE